VVVAERERNEDQDGAHRYAQSPRQGAGSLRRKLRRVLAGERPNTAVRRENIRSWQQSAALGLIPDLFDLPFVGSDERDCRLLGAATPVIDGLGSDLASTEISVMLAGEGCGVVAARAPSPLEEAWLRDLMLSPLAEGSTVGVSIEAVLDGRDVVGARSGSPPRATRRHRHVGLVSQSLRPTFGWDCLTEAEHSVTELVADGLTNREVAVMFVSPHTVDSQLRHVFRKLDISS
jgi:DNA-binding CsgD family transcriptional regulator